MFSLEDLENDDEYKSLGAEDQEYVRSSYLSEFAPQVNSFWDSISSSDDFLGLNIEDQMFVRDQFSSQYGIAPKLKTDSRGLLGTLGDIGLTAGKAAIGAGESIVGLGDLVSGGRVGKYMNDLTGYDPKASKEFLDQYYTDAQKVANQEVSRAEGFGGKLESLYENPSVAGLGILESAPSMLVGGALGRGAGLAAKGLLGGALSPETLGVLGGAAGEGLVTAGSQAEQTRQQSDDELITGKQSLQALGAGLGTGAISALSGGLAQKVGLVDVDTLLAGGVSSATKNGIIKRVTGGMISEGVLEELPQSAQEQIWQNAALGKPLMEGVPEAGAEGMVLGGIMGGGMNIYSPSKPEKSPLAAADKLINAETVDEAIAAAEDLKSIKADILGGEKVLTEMLSDSEKSLKYNQFKNTEQQRKNFMGTAPATTDITPYDIYEPTPPPSLRSAAGVSGPEFMPVVEQPEVETAVTTPEPENVAQEQIEATQPDFTKKSGLPFASEKSLIASAKSNGVDLTGYDIVQVDGGFKATPKQTDDIARAATGTAPILAPVTGNIRESAGSTPVLAPVTGNIREAAGTSAPEMVNVESAISPNNVETDIGQPEATETVTGSAPTDPLTPKDGGSGEMVGQKEFDPMAILTGKQEAQPSVQSTVDIATTALDEFAAKLDAEVKDWSNRKYKENKTRVTAGGTSDDLNSVDTTAGAANERRRQSNIEIRTKAIAEIQKAKEAIRTGKDIEEIYQQLFDSPSVQVAEFAAKQLNNTVSASTQSAPQTVTNTPVQQSPQFTTNEQGVAAEQVETPKTYDNVQKEIDDETDKLLGKYTFTDINESQMYHGGKWDAKWPKPKNLIPAEEIKPLMDMYKSRDAIGDVDVTSFVDKVASDSGVDNADAVKALDRIGIRKGDLGVYFTAESLKNWDSQLTSNLAELYTHFAKDTYADFRWGGTADNPTLEGSVYDEDLKQSGWDLDALKKAESIYNAVAVNRGGSKISLANIAKKQPKVDKKKLPSPPPAAINAGLSEQTASVKEPAADTGAGEKAVKQPWQMATAKEYARSVFKSMGLKGKITDDEVAKLGKEHVRLIKNAINDGLDVPMEVLENYKFNDFAKNEIDRRKATPPVTVQKGVSGDKPDVKIIKKYINSTGRQFAAVEVDGKRVDVLIRGPKDGSVPDAFGNFHPFNESRAKQIKGKAIELAGVKLSTTPQQVANPTPLTPSQRKAVGNSNPDFGTDNLRKEVERRLEVKEDESQRDTARKLERLTEETGWGKSSAIVWDMSDRVAGNDREWISNSRWTSESSITTAEKLSLVFRKKIVWVTLEGEHTSQVFNAFVLPKNFPDTIFIDVRVERPAHALLGHELSHMMAKDSIKLYTEMFNTISPMLKNVAEYAESYGQNEITAQHEMVADLVGDRFDDPIFWEEVAERSKGGFKALANKIMFWLKTVISRVKRVYPLNSDQIVTDIRAAHDAILKAVVKYEKQRRNYKPKVVEDVSNDELQPSLFAPFTGGTPRSFAQVQQWAKTNPEVQAGYEKLALYLWDKDHAIERVQKELGPQPENRDYATLKRLVGKRIANEIETFDREVLKPLLKHLADNKLKMEDVEELAHADHAPEANLQLKRVNARRYIDTSLMHMTDNEKAPYKDRLFDVQEEYVMNQQSLNQRRDNYVDVMDEIADDIISTEQDTFDEIDDLQATLDARTFSPAEIANGKPERLQKRIDNARTRLERRVEVATQWEDVKDRLSGMTNDESDQIKQKWAGNAAAQHGAEELRKMGRESLRMLYESGELAEEEYDAMTATYQNYVPLYREGKSQSKNPTGRAGIGPLARPFKVRAGSTRKVIDIFSHVVDRYQSTVTRKHKGHAARALYQLIRNNPDPDRWSLIEQEKIPYYDSQGNIRFYPDQTEAKNEFYIKVDGVKHLIHIDEDNKPMMRWIESLKRLPTELGPVLKASRYFTRMLAMLNTSFSPEFMITNFFRDIQTAGIHLETTEAKGLQKKVFGNIKSAIKGIYAAERGDDSSEWSQLYRDFAKHGAKISWMQGYEDITELSKQLEKEMEYAEDKHPTKLKLRKFGKWVEAMNTAIENGVRLATYKVLLEKGISKTQSAHTVANLTVDFTRHGTAGPIINSLYLFAGAGIQGNVRMMRAVLTNNKVRKITAGIVGFGALANIMGAMMGGDDDDGESYYDKLKRTNPSIFERNMVFMLPGGKGDYIKIPMPYGYNTFFVLGNEIAGAIRGQNPTEAAARIGSALMSFVNPLASATLLQTIMPTLGDPIAQVMENKAWHGGDLMPKENPFGIPQPDSERYFKSVNPVAKGIGQGLNTITGGDKYKSGLIDMSPESIEMLFETFTGSAGKLAKDALSIPLAMMSDEGLTMNKVPFVRKVVGSFPDFVDSTVYQENQGKVDIFVKRWADADFSEKQELREDPLFKMRAFHKSTESQLRKLNKQMKQAEKSGSKTRQISVKSRMDEVKTRYNKKYNELTK